MNTIKTIALTRLGAVLLNRTGTLLPAILRNLMTDEYVARQVYGVEGALNVLRELKSTTQKSEYTDEIQSTDFEVDTLLPIIERDLISSVEKAAFFPEKGESAEAILELFALRDRKKMFYGGYNDQGEELDTLFKDLFSPAFDAHRNASGAEPLFIKLRTKFDILQELLQERFKEGNALTSAKEQRGILRYRIDKLLAYIDSNIYDNIEGFAAVQTPVNEMITDVMAQYKAEMTRKENQELSE